MQKQKVLEAPADKDCGYFYAADQSNFSKIPGSPVAYNFSPEVFRAFDVFEPLPQYGITMEPLNKQPSFCACRIGISKFPATVKAIQMFHQKSSSVT